MPFTPVSASDPVAPLENVLNTRFAELDNSITASDNLRAIRTYKWANSTARAAQTGMTEGDVGDQADNNHIYRYNGTAWIDVTSGVIPIVPLVSGTGVTVNSDGIVTFTNAGTSGSPINLNGLAGFKRVSVQVEVTAASAPNQVAIRVRNASDDTTASYDATGALFVSGAVSAVASPGLTAWTNFAPVNAVAYSIDFDIDGLDQPRMTRGTQRYNVYQAAAAPSFSVVSISHRAATAWSGISINTGGATTITGTVRVYGYN